MKIEPDTTTETGQLWARLIAESKKTKRAPAHRKGEMNETEARYAAHLSTLMLGGEVRGYYFERFTLRLDTPDEGRATTYCPDFLVIHPATFSIDEVKGGFIREDAMIKFKWACEQFPMIWFRMIQYLNGRFTVIRERKVRQ